MTNDNNGRIPIFGGRFQPFHKGHAHLLERMLREYEKIIVAIVNPDPDKPPKVDFERFQSDANPLNYWERYWIFQTWAASIGASDRVYFVPTWHPRVSVAREAFFFPAQRKRFWWVPDIDESEGAKVADFIRLGEEVRVVDDVPAKDLSYNSTVLRRRMRAGLAWHDAVPDAAITGLEHANFSAQRWSCTSDTTFALFAGRFQPFHKGHLEAIKAALQSYDSIVIGIQCDESPVSDALSPSHLAHNPFNYWQRLGMIHAALTENQIRQKAYLVPLWLSESGQPKEPAFMPRRRVWLVADRGPLAAEEIATLTNAGEDVLLVASANKFGEISGAEVRHQMALGLAWQTLVPDSVGDIIRDTYGTSQVIGLARRYPNEVAQYLASSRHKDEGPEKAKAVVVDSDLQQRFQELEDVIGENIISRQRLAGQLKDQLDVSRLDLPLWRERRSILDGIRQAIADDLARGGSPTSDNLNRLNILGGDCFGRSWVDVAETPKQ